MPTYTVINTVQLITSDCIRWHLPLLQISSHISEVGCNSKLPLLKQIPRSSIQLILLTQIMYKRAFSNSELPLFFTISIENQEQAWLNRWQVFWPKGSCCILVLVAMFTYDQVNCTNREPPPMFTIFKPHKCEHTLTPHPNPCSRCFFPLD